MDIITLVVTLGILFFIINFLDRKSTSIILKYNNMMANNIQSREKWLDYNQQNGLQNELNPFVRFFMKKFGPEKGMIIFTLLYDLPWVTFIILVIIFKIVPEWYGYVVLAFIFGALYVQILKSFTISRRCKKLGIPL